MNQYTKAIKTIINFKKAFNDIDPRVPRKLIGEIGEFYVLQELEKRDFNSEHKGGMGGYDIYLKEKINKKIEVKTSLLKNEGIYSDKTIHFWGWTVEGRSQKKTKKVKNKNRKKIKKFDYLIGVALNDDFSKPKFYIFTYEEAFEVGDVEIGRFKSVKKKIHLFENKRTYQKALKLKPKLVTKFERKINLYPSLFLNKWRKIK